MHSERIQRRPWCLLLGFILFLTAACSSANAPVGTVQTITPTSHLASPTPRTGDTALLTYAGHTQAILSLAWSPNGRYSASGSNDTTVHVWDAMTGKRILIYHGHKTGVTAVSWSPDGTRIASADDKGAVQVWDAGTGGNVFVYTGSGGEVYAAAWSPDGTRIASGGSDSTVQIWKPD